MVRAMLSAVAGLRAHQTRMDVIGDNIANVNTTAFKSNRVTFQDILSQMIDAGSRPSATTGGSNPKQIGLGVKVGSIDSLQTQGSLQLTGNATDLAIQGSGYFMVSDGSSIYYTRDGNFDLDALGYLVASGSGNRVLGLVADDTGAIDLAQQVAAGSQIQIPLGMHTLAKATESITMAGNLDSQTGEALTVETSVEIYDSLGTGHALKVLLTKTETAGEWEWEARVTIGSNQYTVGSGTLTFDENGKCEATSGTIAISAAQFANGAAALSATVDFSSLTQLAGENTVMASDQDGFPMGILEDFTIGSDGLITGIYSNGMTLDLGQITLAAFTNPGGLMGIGGNLFTGSNNSGLAQVGIPGSGSRGEISPGFLEASNVDLGAEFTDMIITQRGFQANSTVITTVDEMLESLIMLKR